MCETDVWYFFRGGGGDFIFFVSVSHFERVKGEERRPWTLI